MLEGGEVQKEPHEISSEVFNVRNNMRRPPHNTTKLPKQLLDQLGEQGRSSSLLSTIERALTSSIDGSSGGAHSRKAKTRNGPGQRKENRKAERQQKKVQRQPSRRPQIISYGAPLSISLEDGGLKTLPLPVTKSQVKKPTQGEQKPPKSILKRTVKEGQSLRTYGDVRSPSPPPALSRGVRDKLAQDDAEIAALEKRLGMKGKKRLPKSFEEDGLDLLIDGLSEEVMETNGKRKRSEEKEWLERKRRKAEGVAESASSGEGEDGLPQSEESDLEEPDDEEISFGSSSNNSDNEEEGFEDFDAITSPPSPPRKRVRENPYVAPSVSGAVQATTKYIPPSLRGPPSSEVQSLAQLRRQMQGLLNRLSEANLVTILGDVEKLYRDHPRQHVTSTLIELLLGLLCDRTNLMDTFLILHAGFIAAVYKFIGTDFGAQILQRIVEDFEKFYTDSKETSTGKETSNLISLLAELYNFQVVGSTLMFDYIRIFLAELSEVNTEMLLKVIRSKLLPEHFDE